MRGVSKNKKKLLSISIHLISFMFSKLRKIWQDAYNLKTVFPLVNSCQEYESRGVKV